MSTKIVSIDLGLRSYDIYIGSALLYRLGEYVPDDLEGRSVFLITDENVKSYATAAENALKEAGAREAQTLVLPPGEQTKSFKQYQYVCEWLLQNGLTRDSIVFAVGGGVIGDLAGFAASSVMRGVTYIQVPTSLLAQVDSAVGGKTGINTGQGKNLVGSFYQPAAVVADLESLKTLPQRELLAGYAEVVKYGLIRDAGFFEWLEQGGGTSIVKLEEKALIRAIGESCEAKAAVVQADETERGQRALLNLGHTFGHALESAGHYDGRLLHGEAVAIGTVMAFDLSVRLGHCPIADKERVEDHFRSVGLPTHPSMVEPGLDASVTQMMKVMGRDKKVVGGKMRFILVNGIGDAFVSGDVPEEIVRELLADYVGDKKSKWKLAFSFLSSR
jgi:3-dehydroquinate synthase